MKKWQALTVALLCTLLVLEDPGVTYAQKGRSYSGGSSRSSGGSSRPSGGSSSSRPSAPSSSGRSYSSGNKSTPAARPSTPSSPPRTSPSPPKTSPASPPPSTKSASGTTPSATKSTTSAPATGSPSTTSSTPTLPRGRSYGSGSATKAAPGGKTASTGGYDDPAARAMRQQESRQTYQKGQAPRPTYRDSSGKESPLDPSDRRIEDIRTRTSTWDWSRREERRRTIFGPTYTTTYPGPVMYRDSYSNFFWTWLLLQSLDTRSSWAYHHRSSMDEARYQEMLRKDRELETRVRAMEQEGVTRNPTYTPAGVDTDLMYSDEYVEAALNPQPTSKTPRQGGPTRTGWAKKLLTTILLILLFGFVVWLVFIKRWNVGRNADALASSQRERDGHDEAADSRDGIPRARHRSS